MEHLTVVLQNSRTGAERAFNFRLRPGPLVDRWIRTLRFAIRMRAVIEDAGHFYGQVFYEKRQLERDLETNLRLVENNRPGSITCLIGAEIDRQYLNSVHDDFERIDAQAWSKTLPETIRQALRNLNTLVHKLESFLEQDDMSWIGVVFAPSLNVPLQEEEFRLFDPDIKAGTVYMSYGQTGVPVQWAYYHRPKEPPVPQTTLSPGFCIHVGPDQIYPDRQGLRDWLRETYGWELDNPRCAFGYLQLGEIAETSDLAFLTSGAHLFDRVQNLQIVSSPILKSDCLPQALETEPRHLSLYFDLPDGERSLLYGFSNDDLARRWFDVAKLSSGLGVRGGILDSTEPREHLEFALTREKCADAPTDWRALTLSVDQSQTASPATCAFHFRAQLMRSKAADFFEAAQWALRRYPNDPTLGLAVVGDVVIARLLSEMTPDDLRHILERGTYRRAEFHASGPPTN